MKSKAHSFTGNTVKKLVKPETKDYILFHTKS